MTSFTRRATSTRQDRREQMAAQMLGVVEGLLEEGDTFAELSVERLITAAEISRSTFYVYFEDKGALLLALAEDVVAQLVAAAQAWWMLPPDAGKEDVGAALRSIIGVYREHSLIWGSLVDAASYDPSVRAAFREIVGISIADLTEHIRDGIATGSVREGVDPGRTAQWLTWMTERGLYQLTPGASADEIDRLCRAQTEIVWQTLYAGASTRRSS